MLTIYKPNSSNKGSLLSVNFYSKQEDGKLDSGSFFNFVLQNGWNDKTKKGAFKDGKKYNLKFNITELAGFIYAIENNTGLAKALFHDSPNATTQIFFEPAFKQVKENDKWVKTDKQAGFRLRITQKKSGEDKGESFGIGLDFNEATLFKLALINIINSALNAEVKFQADKFNESRSNSSNSSSSKNSKPSSRKNEKPQDDDEEETNDNEQAEDNGDEDAF